jgi:hypothetical protein
MDVHVAQLNIARLVAPIDAPEIADFVAALDEINGLGESSPGFVWRLQTDEGNATSVQAYDDPLVIVNLTVWESVEALKDFTYRSDHTNFLRRRAEWFERADGPSVVLWWIAAGHIPTVDEAKQRLDTLRLHGPGPDAFTFRRVFPPEGTHPDPMPAAAD